MADSPVSPTQSPANDEELVTIVICGPTSAEWFGCYDLDSSSWKIRQASLLTGQSEPFSETWPKAGMMQNGRCYRREMRVLSTNVSECLSLPTLGANEGKGSSAIRFIGSPHFRGAKMSEGLRTCASDPIYLNPSFGEVVMGFPLGYTPSVTPSSPKLLKSSAAGSSKFTEG